jgi:hypothetical protein
MALFEGSSNASTLTFSTFSIRNEFKLVVVLTLPVVRLSDALLALGQLLVQQITFDYTSLGITFTASNSDISAVQYAVIHDSAGKLLCWSKLSSSPFSISDPNTLTVLPAATGVFTLT